jgi:hypothetical protein
MPPRHVTLNAQGERISQPWLLAILSGRHRYAWWLGIRSIHARVVGAGRIVGGFGFSA